MINKFRDDDIRDRLMGVSPGSVLSRVLSLMKGRVLSLSKGLAKGLAKGKKG